MTHAGQQCAISTGGAGRVIPQFAAAATIRCGVVEARGHSNRADGLPVAAVNRAPARSSGRAASGTGKNATAWRAGPVGVRGSRGRHGTRRVCGFSGGPIPVAGRSAAGPSPVARTAAR